MLQIMLRGEFNKSGLSATRTNWFIVLGACAQIVAVMSRANSKEDEEAGPKAGVELALKMLVEFEQKASTEKVSSALEKWPAVARAMQDSFRMPMDELLYKYLVV